MDQGVEERQHTARGWIAEPSTVITPIALCNRAHACVRVSCVHMSTCVHTRLAMGVCIDMCAVCVDICMKMCIDMCVY